MMDVRKLGECPWCQLWLMAASLLCLLAGSWSLKIVRVQVPASVQAGDTVQLHCHFDLETDKLYSLTWWREQHQFYQFTPAAAKTKSKYDTLGIHVDEARSSMNTVVLRNVSLDTAGKYKCEVVADFTFEKDFQLKDMEVIGKWVKSVSLGFEVLTRALRLVRRAQLQAKVAGHSMEVGSSPGVGRQGSSD
nr:uncharacterized protein LOC128686528 [Cherax quadricarinatus]